MTTTNDQDTTSRASSVDHNRYISRHWIEAFNRRDESAQRDVLGPDYVAHAPVSLEPSPLSPETWETFLAGFVEGFPDLQLTVEDSVAEGDLVAQRVSFAGTHTGHFNGLPPTNRRVSFSGLEINRFVDGRVAEHWFQLDSLSLLQQLGLVLVPGPKLLPRILVDGLRKLVRKGRRP